MEVSCEPVRIVDDIGFIFVIFIMAAMLWSLMALMSAWLIAFQVISSRCYFHAILPGLAVLAAAGASIGSAISYYMEGKQRKAQARFARFFGMFTHIETLVLHNFKNQEPVFEALKKALKDVNINQLEVRDTCVFEYFRLVLGQFVWPQRQTFRQ